MTNLREARLKLEEFVAALNMKNEKIALLNADIREQDKVLEEYRTKVDDKNAYFREERRLREYYQRVLFKFIRDLDVLKNDGDK